MEKISSREQFISHMMSEERGGKPIFLFDLSLGLDVLGVPTTRLFQGGEYDGCLSGKAILALQRQLDHDAVAGSYQSIDYAAFGGEMQYPEWGTPYMSKAPFSDGSSFYRHEPSEIEAYLKGTKTSFSTVRKGSSNIGLLMNIPAPMSVAVTMRGLQTFLMDMLLEPEFARDQISFGGEVSKISIQGVSSETNLDAILLTGPFDNLDLVGPEALRSFSFPPLNDAMRNIHRFGLPIVFHPHSAFTADKEGQQILMEEIEMGVDCLYYGECNDPDKILAQTKGRCSIMGGIDTFTTIYLGPDERVVNDVEECLSHFNDENYIFTCSCSVDRGLSLDRMKMMVDAVRGYGGSKERSIRDGG